jgi:hypothetical protein
MPERRSGKVAVHEVFRRGAGEDRPEISETVGQVIHPMPEHVGTFWDAKEATIFYTALMGFEPEIYSKDRVVGMGGSGQQEVDIVVADDMAYYKICEDGVPVDFIHETAAAAALGYIEGRPDQVIPEGVQKLAAAAVASA